MKGTLLTTIGIAACALSALGQGQVIFENSLGTGNIVLEDHGPLVANGGYTVALLWYNGSTFQQIATYQPNQALNSSDGTGYFYDPTVVNVPTYSATGTFIVQAWFGSYSSYAAAQVGGGGGFDGLVGQTPSFVSAEGNPNAVPIAQPPAYLSGGSGSGWDGNLLIPVPEPTTTAIGVLSGAALLIFRRRK